MRTLDKKIICRVGAILFFSAFGTMFFAACSEDSSNIPNTSEQASNSESLVPLPEESMPIDPSSSVVEEPSVVETTPALPTSSTDMNNALPQSRECWTNGTIGFQSGGVELQMRPETQCVDNDGMVWCDKAFLYGARYYLFVKGSTNEILRNEDNRLLCSGGQWEVLSIAGYLSSPLVDGRDGKTYKTLTIGSQTWMAENLNYEAEASDCYDGTPNNCAQYGRLYVWNEAKEACPSGWHLPTQVEWSTLFEAVGGVSVAGKMLKSLSGWNLQFYNELILGYDAYGFSAYPAGARVIESDFFSFKYVGEKAYFWTASEISASEAQYVSLSNTDHSAFINEQNIYYRMSVRCVMDAQ